MRNPNMLKAVHINNMMLFVWWVNIVLQSVFDLSWIYVAVFLFTTTYVLYKDYRYGVLFLIVSYFVPYTSSYLPSPFLIITLLSFGFYLLSVGFQLKRCNNRYYLILLFLFLAPIFSILFQGSELSDKTVVTYILSGVSLLIYASIFEGFDERVFFESMLKKILFFISIAFIVSYVHTLLEQNTNLYNNIFIANQSDDFLMKIYTESSMEVRRLIWVGIDPNYFAAQFIFFFLLSLYFSQEETKYYFYSGLIAFSIIGTFSRTAFLVMSFSFISAMFLHRQKSKLFILGVIGFIILIFYNYDYISRIDTIVDNISNKGGTGRFELIRASLEVWGDNIFGVGIGNLSDTKYGSSSYVKNFSSHSTFFQILVESGVHFFILFLSSIVILILPNKLISLNRLSYFSLIGIVFTLFFYITIPVYDFRLFFLMVLIYVTSMKLNVFSKKV
ncbi:O-antigen ligase family protein [Shewanella oncorhynchi]|uniref:O-antigen ligase family protein n=1 Tax=Shewanella oncorhynchi TaxID=2726434 RepID=UPI003D79BC2C